MLPDLFLVAGTRVLLGTGIGLLLADRLAHRRRRAIGWALFLGGAASTIPIAYKVLGQAGSRSGVSQRDTGLPGGGSGRRDATGIMPEGIKIDPDIMEGHPGYQESGDSEIISLAQTAALTDVNAGRGSR